MSMTRLKARSMLVWALLGYDVCVRDCVGRLHACVRCVTHLMSP